MSPRKYGKGRMIKRFFDIVLSLVFLIILSPIILLITIIIKMDSVGPVFYKQTRIGENGKLFEMIKFRSMRTGAPQNDHKEYMTRLIQENVNPANFIGVNNGSLKRSVDPRITPFGAFIRRFSLDELPQFYNVAIGDMSLVGPRPPLPYEVEVYEEWHMRRLEALPGITGLWQVTARNQVSFDEMVCLDIEYIDNYSIWMDLKIILQTPWAIVNGHGAG